jgi:glycosyltransferase involved in cell wall biosynthesis
MSTISTVIIPAYNEGGNIVKTIQELIALYGDKIEVLVVVDFADSIGLNHIEYLNLINSTKCLQF